MQLFNKIKPYIDYNNHYTIIKALRSLDLEFNKALKKNDKRYATDILDIVKRIYSELNEFYRKNEDYGETMSYNQRVLSTKLQAYIYLLSQKLKINPTEQIKKIIN